MNLDITPGVLGAKRATWRDANPRKLLQDIIEANPNGPETLWRKLFWERVESDDDQIQAIVAYWLDNHVRYIQDHGPDTKQETAKKGPAAQAAEQKTETVKENVKSTLREHIVREARVILLEIMMPNGKKLAQCTGADCKNFGGWLTAVATKVPAKKKVADILSEAEVRKLWLAQQS
jgi:hypothetical protein